MKTNFFLGLIFMGIATISGRVEAGAPALFPDQDLSCEVTSADRRYEDLLLIEVREAGFGRIMYQRQHRMTAPGTFGPLEVIRGCTRARQVLGPRPGSISVECESDGEEGMVLIEEQSLKGEVFFYHPKIGYPERTLLEVSCRRI